ncbi:MAG: carboxypeptidase regulatory-like domain-containing protein [Bryobacteraceae bacterium]
MPVRGTSALRNACAMILFSAMLLYASLDRGIIQGIVADPQGAVLPGAEVVVTNIATNVKAALKTNSEGFYVAAELVPGDYSVHVLATGFAPINITGIVVKAGVTSTVGAQLQLGAVMQSVSVSADAPLIQTGASNFSTTLEERYVQSIPLQGRDIQSLIQLIPGVTQSAGPSAAIFGFNSEFGGFPDPLHIVGSTVSANGGQGGANEWYLDGTPNISSLAGNVVVNPSPDAVAEFNVVDNGLAAEWGRTSGAVVNIALKSGTNVPHGDIYEFNQNSYFSATNPFARRDAEGRPFLQPRVNWNDFGGTFGGPVYLPHIYNGRNRTFFFISWDTAMLSENKPTILTVPLPQEKLGNFTGDPRFAAVCGANGATNCLYDAYSTTGPDANGQFHRTPFSTPVIPSSRIDPLAGFYLSSYPSPNRLASLYKRRGDEAAAAAELRNFEQTRNQPSWRGSGLARPLDMEAGTDDAGADNQ